MPSRKGNRKGQKQLKASSEADMSTDSQPSRTESEVHLPPYFCTGNFEKDFTQLCHRLGMEVLPPVIPRPHRPVVLLPIKKVNWGMGTSLSVASGLSQKKSLSKRLSKSSEKVVSATTQPILAVPTGPTTYTVADKFKFFKPCVQVESKQKGEGVQEVYIRSWLVDDAVMGVLNQCCVAVQHLALLQLWNVGLTASTLNTLASFLPLCHSLTTLLLDANPFEGEQEEKANLSELIGELSSVEHLSLRFCKLTDVTARQLGSALGTTLSWNKRLLTLNLSNNRITDEGVRHLARGLMTNRTLLVLNLAANDIGDDGAAALAQVLSYFALDMSQLKHRRMLILDREQQHMVSVSRNSSMSYHSMDHRQKRRELTRVLSVSSEKKKKKGGKEILQKNSSLHQTTKAQSDMYLGLHYDGALKGRRSRGNSASPIDLRKGSERQRSRHHSRSEEIRKSELRLPVVPPGEWHPLVEPSCLGEDGELRVLGNRSLMSLNLSQNRVKEAGLRCLLDMLQSQQQLPTQPPPSYVSLLGLKRLVVHRNAVPADNGVLLRIQHLSRIRDPLYRVPLLSLHRDNVVPCAMPRITV